MSLRDRLRRWWSPAQWEDDHPTERKQRDQRNKNQLGRWFSSPTKKYMESTDMTIGSSGRTDYERDFKKPR
jgi:hypothetical protein